MDNQFELRFMELQLYLVCKDILTLHNSLPDVLNYIEFLQTYDKTLNIEVAKLIVQEMLTSLRFRPSDEEVWLAYYIAKYPISTIREKFKIHNRQLYTIVSKHKESPLYLYARLRPDQHAVIEQCLKVVKIIRKAGFFND